MTTKVFTMRARTCGPIVLSMSLLGCSSAGSDDEAGGDSTANDESSTDGSESAVRYANKRAEMWGHMKEWCRFGCLPDDRELRADLTAVDYGYDAADAIRLEKKDDMRRRGLASPDDGDALALTFAYPVERRNWQEEWRFQQKLAGLRRRVV